MKNRSLRRVPDALVLFGVLASMASTAPAKTIRGTITEVKEPTLLVLRHEVGEYKVRIFGLESPKSGTPLAVQAREKIEALVLGKEVRLRFKLRNNKGEMVGRLFVDDAEVGVELVRAGLVKWDGSSEKNGELEAAQQEARDGKVGLWSDGKAAHPKGRP